MKRKLLSLAIALSAALFFYRCSDTEELGLTQEQLQSAATEDTQSRTSTSGTTVASTEFNENVGTAITGADGRRWIANYLNKNPEAIRSHYFGSKAFMRILGQPNVVGISLTYAINDEGKQQLILIGVDNQGNLVMPSASTSLLKGEAEMVDASWVCPTVCPK
jgi:hypothetical protein